MRRVFVVSDLHLGGRPDERDARGQLTRTGFQICHAYAELAAFIDWVSEQAREKPSEIELVVNGDIVDFLADDEYGDPPIGASAWTESDASAVRKLEKIFDRARGRDRGVFEALRDLLRRGLRLTLLLGNHDVELSLPAVRRRLIRELNADDARLELVYDGEAHAIGRVLIEHGNRYDNFNQVDHSRLRQERSVRSRGLSIDRAKAESDFFVAPGGTLLVIHLMNPLKSKYRFIDLLKPEDTAVIPILLALEPKLRPGVEELLSIPPILDHLRRHGLASPARPKQGGDLGGKRTTPLSLILSSHLGTDAPLVGAVARPTLPDANEGNLGGLRATGLGATLARWYETARSAASAAQKGTQWGAIAMAEDDQERRRALHAALRPLAQGDRSFALAARPDTYLDSAKALLAGGAFDLVVFGHTHLARWYDLSPELGRPSWYLNTGTWADVMRLPETLAGDYAAAGDDLAAFVGALAANDFGPYLRRQLTYAEIELTDDDSVRSCNLFSFGGLGNERVAPLGDSFPDTHAG